MDRFDRYLKMALAAALVLAFVAVGDARTRKGDKFLAEGEVAESHKDWDAALDAYEKAMAEDSTDVAYQIAIRRVRFQAGEMHIGAGIKMRDAGEIDKALVEFQKAYAIDPSSDVADQELKKTLAMIERNRERGAELTPKERTMTPAELSRDQEKDKLARLMPPPFLKPLSAQPINLRMANQPAKVLYETVGKLAGINVVFDPDYASDPNARRNTSVDLNNSTLDDALDYLATMTHTFWKPLSANAIFVTTDSLPKRRDFEDNAVQVFYLTNLTTPQELQEISTVLRTVADIKKVFTYSSMNAIIARGTPDQILLAEKLVNDLDKPKSEVVVDVIVMEADRTKTQNLAAAISSNGTSGGINTQIQFTPRNPVLLGGSSSTASPTATPTATSEMIALSRVGHISTGDFSITMPGALLQATMADSATKILQSPQVRAASGQKASLRIGEKYPIASGGIQPFGTSVGGTTGGYGGLYQNFTFVDIGVNVDITPTVHGDKEVTLKAVLEISTHSGDVNVGGVTQPIIGQRKVEHEIRIREGEVSLLGGLMEDQDIKSVSGVPGLSSIPLLGKLFTSNTVEKDRNELLIALIPHIVRTPGITDVNMRAIAAGTEQNTHLSLSPSPAAPGPAASAEGPKPAPAPETAAPAPSTTPAPPAPAPGPGTRLLLKPETIEVKPDQTFTIQFDVNDARDLYAAPFKLKFDPQLLRLEEVAAGGFLSSDSQKIIFTRNILNDTGDATVHLNRMPDSTGLNGTGALAVFTFKAIKPGAALVTFSDLAARDSHNQPVSEDVPRARVTIR
ncbi:MAG TPA: cohesin domain-containing protein [Bryobacteraceae bacterium]|nr:cohesin domain-containing protein [Bryobacteraceae bacterium]